MQHTGQQHTRTYPLLLLWYTATLLLSCSTQKDLPHITAQITTVYRDQIVLDGVTFVYWWEERGKTPFLKPYTLRTTDYIVEVLEPLPNQPNRVHVRTRHIPLQEIAAIDISLTDNGKKVLVTMRDGAIIEATAFFPRELRKDPKSGIADHKIYIEGRILEGRNAKKHRQELDYISSIKILNSSQQQ